MLGGGGCFGGAGRAITGGGNRGGGGWAMPTPRAGPESPGAALIIGGGIVAGTIKPLPA